MSYLTFWLSLPIRSSPHMVVHARGTHVESDALPNGDGRRLLHPDTGDWLMYREPMTASGFSPLNQIIPSNIRRPDAGMVGEYRPAWSTRNDANRQSRPDVHHDASKQHHRAGRQDRNALWRYARSTLTACSSSIDKPRRSLSTVTTSTCDDRLCARGS